MRSANQPKPPRSQDSETRRFALARDLIQRNRRQDSLAVLDAVLRNNQSRPLRPKREAKVAALVGDYQKKRGDFASAADYYAVAAAKLDSKDTRQWFRPTLGQIRALLSEPAVDQAFELAKNTWIKAKSSAREFDATTEITVDKLKALGRIEIAPRPLRPSVVASRLGEAFLQAGEWEMAEFFFNEALLVNPHGGSRARQALAKIALAAEEPAEAETRAFEALLLGKYRAKTLSAWPLLISSRAQQKKPLFTPQDRSGLRSIHAASVRARAILVICKAIRPYDDTWMDIATEWVAAEGLAFPAIRFELEKLMRSEARLAGVITREQAATALRHARTPGASPAEAIAAGKAYVRTALLAGAKKVQWSLVSNHLERRYGAKVADRAVHSMSLGAMDAGRHDLAREMLDEIRLAVPPTRVQWMRSTWALARMEQVLGNHAAVYATYGEIAQNQAVPSRFRAQAVLRALRCAEAANLEVAPADVSWLEGAISAESDPRVLLDLGRQLGLAGSAFRALRDQAADRATVLSEAKLAEAKHPAVALGLLLELNRRQFYDFGRQAQVVAQFETYASARLDWLWSPRVDFWEWYGIVVNCIGRVRGWTAGLQAADKYLKDPGTPSEGIAMLAVKTGTMLMSASQNREAMPLFAQAIQASPNAIIVGGAYYWTAVHALARGDTALAKANAEKVRRCYNFRPSLAEEWRYDAQALLIIKDRNTIEAAMETGNTYSPAYLTSQAANLDRALRSLID